MFTVNYWQGNGYHCGCCRSVYDEDIELDTEGELKDWLVKLAADKKYYTGDDNDNDRGLNKIFKTVRVDIEGVEKEALIDITDEYEDYEKKYSDEIELEVKRRKDSVKKKESDKIAAIEKRQRQQYEMLKEKFEK